MKHFLLTIDVEDWFQVENLRPWFPMENWSSQESRIEASTRSILDMLGSKRDEQGNTLQATFFVLGWLAHRMPSLVREISAAGHEVASHGYSHQLCLGQPASELRRDLERSKKVLEDILGSAVHGYRAPSFSISREVLALIREAGYSYDASYNSFALNSRYGRLSADVYRRKGIAMDLGEGFYELPLSNLRIWGRSLPCSGGGYFRLLPEMVFKRAVQRILATQDAYHFYIHPWEVDPGQPMQNQIPVLSRFRHYVNLKETLPRLGNLLDSFLYCRFCSCRDYLESIGNSGN
ncbi:XrtA system polysaccharide deacetylase [Desulfonatronospira sp.]|nr:XrtA system polysaccharide deacetylase [Desulfonatronospira sp.]